MVLLVLAIGLQGEEAGKLDWLLGGEERQMRLLEIR